MTKALRPKDRFWIEAQKGRANETDEFVKALFIISAFVSLAVGVAVSVWQGGRNEASIFRGLVFGVIFTTIGPGLLGVLALSVAVVVSCVWWWFQRG